MPPTDDEVLWRMALAHYEQVRQRLPEPTPEFEDMDLDFRNDVLLIVSDLRRSLREQGLEVVCVGEG